MMVGTVLSLATVFLLALATLSSAAPAAYERGQIIVKFIPEVGTVSAQTKDGLVSVGIASLDQKMARYGVQKISQVFPHKVSELAHIYQVDYNAPYDAKTVAGEFSQDHHLLYAEPRYLHRVCDSPNDPNFQNGLQWFFAKVQAPEAWDLAHGDSAVVVGIVDTGVDKNHPDLMDNRWFNLGEDANGNGYFDNGDWNRIDDDENGFVDDFFGWDFEGLYGLPDGQPDENADLHGTHSAGLCCAITDNELANAGMSWNCLYMTVKVSRDGETLIRSGYEGIQYAADMGATVINIGWARTGERSDFEQEIIDSAFVKGAILVAAAGNDEPGNAYAPPDTCPIMYPAAYDHVTAVAATDISDRAASFTYYGTWVDVAAPGNGIYSHLWDDSYSMRSSTSAACALVSGVAALMKTPDWEPDINSDEFEVRMQTTSDPIVYSMSPEYAGWLGGGRLNAYRALIDCTDVVEPVSLNRNLPDEYVLLQNYPNPFNPNTTISYQLPVSGLVRLNIFNVRGQLVKTLVNQDQPAGTYTIQWDGRDEQGQTATSGIYFYQLKSQHWSEVRKMVLMR
jgi:subtilisin family serine protease